MQTSHATSRFCRATNSEAPLASLTGRLHARKQTLQSGQCHLLLIGEKLLRREFVCGKAAAAQAQHALRSSCAQVAAFCLSFCLLSLFRVFDARNVPLCHLFARPLFRLNVPREHSETKPPVFH